MYRNYRLRHERAPNELIVDPLYVPTRIVVRMMNGEEHILFTEEDGETFFHVKEALHPYVVGGPALHRLSLSLKRDDGTYEPDVENGRVIPTLDNRDVNLELLIKDLTMNAEQQALIYKWTRSDGDWSEKTVQVYNTDFNTPDKVEAFLFYLENNEVTTLKMMLMDIHQIMIIMRAILSQNIPIERLYISYEGPYNSLSPDKRSDEMRDVFEMIRQINTLHVLQISNDRNLIYRMNDLADLLDQTSLRRVFIYNGNIILDGEDVTRLSHVLMRHPTLGLLQLGGLSRSDKNVVKDFMESFEHIIDKRDRYFYHHLYESQITLYWKNRRDFPPSPAGER